MYNKINKDNQVEIRSGQNVVSEAFLQFFEKTERTSMLASIKLRKSPPKFAGQLDRLS